MGTPLGLEAFLLGRANEHQSCFDILALGFVDIERGPLLLDLLVRDASQRWKGPLRLPRIERGEAEPPLLTALGFRSGRRFVKVAAEALPG